MQGLNRAGMFAIAVAVGGIAQGGIVATTAFAQIPRTPESQTVRVLRGSISGSVSDEHGGPVAGAKVSAFGQTMAVAVTDVSGNFSIDSLPYGDYVIQAHLTGFAGSRRESVRVGASLAVQPHLQIRRLDTVAATTGVMPVSARPIMAAGVPLPSVTLSDQPEGKDADASDRDDDHPHSETAWRLRHIRRSVLKDTNSVVTLADNDAPPEISSGSIFNRAVDAASLAATFFSELPFSGEVNLLTTGALGPGGLFGGDALPRGVAYLAIGAPMPGGDWSVRAAMSQGDLSSWIVAGAFQARKSSPHVYEFGYSYATQEYLGGNPAALAGVKDGSRNVGELYAYDQWWLSPRLAVEYGGRFARYDYLPDRSLLSPRVGLSIEPVKNTHITATVAQRMVAPGAEEFLATETPGPWLPPERTFAPLGSPADRAFQVERARYVDMMVSHEFDDHYVLGLRRFYQDVDDQLVTLFGLNLPDGPRSEGHYYVASAGAVEADGWAVRVSSPEGKRVRGTVDYSVTRARWQGSPDVDEISPFAPAAVRPEFERLHDVTTSFETNIPETATRVFVLYRINTGYTRSDTELTKPGLDARFDVQVNQALPFGIGGTKWEVLVGVRNLFRDPNEPGSIYDELLVVRPPKRLVGGFLVRF
jgi:carboxypeptidase family protein/TonB-dependent receptor-like protein